MENLENENENLRAKITTLRCENATLSTTVDRLVTLVKDLLAKQTPSHPLPPQPSPALLHGKGYPQEGKDGPHSNMTIVPVIKENPPVQVQIQQCVNQVQQQHHKKIHFDPIPVTYTELYPLLISKNLVRPRQPPAVPKKLPWWYKPKASCAHHQGAPGHDLEKCCTLKTEVQKLVQAGILIFQGKVAKINQTTSHQTSPDNSSRAMQQPQQKRITSFNPFPMTYTELYPTLIAENLVQIRQPPAVPKKLPWWYKTEASCAFHQNAPGHSLEDCFSLKVEVQKLMRVGILTFKEVVIPSVKINSMPNHASASTSMLDTDQ